MIRAPHRKTWAAQALAGFILLAATAAGEDWPQWQGPRRDSTWREDGILERFPAGGPRVLWRAPIAGGYSGPAVAQGRVYVTDFVRRSGEFKNDPGLQPRLEGVERTWCLDAASGKPLWKHESPVTYEISYPAGPRATPTVDEDRVYILGAEGNLWCLDTKSGEVRWNVDFKKDYQAPTPIWGFCAHPLVDGDRLVCLVGGEGSVAVAFDKRTGKELWRALSAPHAGYAPPVRIEAGGKAQLVVWHPTAVQGLDPETAEVFWSVELEPDYGMSINPAVRAGDYLFVGGIVNKAVLLKLAADRPAVEEVWRASPQVGIGPVFAPPYPEGPILYGVDRGGEMTALELVTGKKLWQTYQPTTGTRRANSATAFLVKNGDRFFLMSETGDLIIARMSPEKYEEIDRVKLLEPTHEAFGRLVLWSHPAFANRCVFARNDQELICVSLAQ